jgi:hypothetical protein
MLIDLSFDILIDVTDVEMDIKQAKQNSFIALETSLIDKSVI